MAGIAKDVKEQIIARIKAGEPVAEVSKTHGVSTKTIYSWLASKAQGDVTIKDFLRIRRENQAMKEIIGALTIELASLKKKGAVRKG
ncbi:IS630 transposase-related protein [Patescibacteria group bacterium]|nr:IS630 transposase-related protein [Patescibacteria group bacterium]MBU1970408.1 IS630 transposase-related protein [Patescibacteria group bacterium]